MQKIIAAVSLLIAGSIVSVSPAIGSPTSFTTSNPPTTLKRNQLQANNAPVNPVGQPTVNNQNSQPENIPKERDMESMIEAQATAATRSGANQCRGDARFENPPVVNNPHHIRNVVWRNMRTICAK